MSSLLFLLTAVAMIIGWAGRWRLAVGVFVVAFLLSLAWLNHHITDPLALGF
ncbi:MAG: hypothetical protein J0H82_07695 [Alphaproteobacteria bacterium]|jgi:hypothetical protein|nr:hypothetical protein [Alphaproteobacteria bacterium]